MSNLNLTRDWLLSVLRPFSSRDRILQEVMQILGERRTLAVKTEAFTHDTGQTALLLLLHGTLPITYRGATYQIPIHLWVPHDYPRAPPMAFVMPTKDMGVRKGREVEPSGRVKEEIVAEWWRTWDTKTLDVLLKHLTEVFSAAPPVYAKPATAGTSSPAVQSPSTSTRTPGPVTAPDSQSSPRSPHNYYPPSGLDTLPTYQPAHTPPHPYAQSQTQQTPGPYEFRPPATPPHNTASPPVPSRPVVQRPPHPQSPMGVPPVPHRPYSGLQQNSIRGDSTGATVNGFNGHQLFHDRGWTQGTLPAGYGSPSSVPQQSGVTLRPQTQQPAAVSGPSQGDQTKSRTLPVPLRSTQDLLSSPENGETPLPLDSYGPSQPPPPPPSKPPPPSLLHLHSLLLPHLQASLPPLLHSLHSSVEQLQARREDLATGEPAIRDEMARLEAVKKVCDSVGRKMEDVVHQGEERVAELEAKGEVGVDELVCGISIVHNQLIDLVAEDNAIEDTIYHITRALDAERIDLDRYLKSIRSLAREQYMKRALIERILQGMGQTQGW